MMTAVLSLLLIAPALAFALPSAFAVETKSAVSLQALGTGLPSVLVHPRLTPESRLVLDATEELIGLSSSDQRKAIRSACEKWRATAPPAIDGHDPELLVLWPGGGTLWKCGPSGGESISEWDDFKAPYTRQPQRGRFFGFGGGQFSFGNSSAWGVTLGVGTTFFRERADFSLAQAFSKAGGNGSYSLSASSRLRFPIDEKVSWNAGPQLAFSVSGGSSTLTAAALGGVSIFVSTGGSIDFVASLATNGNYAFLTGYTFFFEAR